MLTCCQTFDWLVVGVVIAAACMPEIMFALAVPACSGHASAGQWPDGQGNQVGLDHAWTLIGWSAAVSCERVWMTRYVSC